MKKILILLAGIMFVAASPMQANNHIPGDQVSFQDTLATMPKVFLLGSHEGGYDELSEAYQTSLLAANNDDTQVAGHLWNSMIKEMEAHAEMINYDIKGAKMWLHIFWDDKGKIQHIGYYLKPNSRNVDRKELTAFLTDFVNNYYLPAEYESNFSHYSGAAFPTLNWKKKNELASKGKQ